MLMLVMPVSFTLAIGLGTPGATVWSIFWLSPLLTVAFAHVLLAERASWEIWAAAATGASAAVVILRPEPPSSPLGLLLPILMGLSFSVYVVMTRSLRHEATRANLLYSALGVFLALTPFMPMIWITPTLYDVGVLIAIGVTGLVALLALDRSSSMGPVSAVAPVLYLHVVCLSTVDLLLHGQRPSRGFDRRWVCDRSDRQLPVGPAGPPHRRAEWLRARPIGGPCAVSMQRHQHHRFVSVEKLLPSLVTYR